MQMLPEIGTILYCTRIGPNSAYIYRYAVAMAERFGARIIVLHVVSALSPAQEALIDAYIGPESIHAVIDREEDRARARIRKHLEVFCAKAGKGHDCSRLVDRIRIREGHAAEEILAEAAASGADLIVMGAHASSTVLDAIMGSTAEKVIRRATIPVLVVQVPEGQQELSVAGI
ncbi:MAG: universal stress protein [Thermodesulfobacteriota bacterium]